MQSKSEAQHLIDILERSVRRNPHGTAVVDNAVSLSYSKLYERSANLAASLARMGCRPGDRVGCIMDKRSEAVVAFLACALAGTIFFPVDFNQTRPHLQFVFDLTRPSALIVQKKFMPLLAGLHLPFDHRHLIILYAASDTRSGSSEDLRWDDLVRTTPDAGWAPARTAMDAPVYLNFTSGTTGTPKAAVTTNANLYWNTRSAIDALQLREDDVHLSMFPVFGHPHELFMRGLMLGGTSVLVDGIAPRMVVESIIANRVTCMMAVASIYRSLLKFIQGDERFPASLRLAESGGMAVGPELVENFKRITGIHITPVWGSTETCGIALINAAAGDGTGGLLSPRLGATGRPAPYYEVKLTDDVGDVIDKPGQVGQLCVRGAGVCREYFGNDTETAHHFRDGWFNSGDLFKYDNDGYLYFAGRASRLIKMAGIKVYPTEIEDVIAKHPQVLEVAVVRALDQRHGEIPRAVIVPVDGAQMTAESMRKYCYDLLEQFKVPRIFEFRDCLPRNPVGKILYRELEDES